MDIDKEEIKKELETRLWLLKDSATNILELLEKYGEQLLPLDYLILMKVEAKNTEVKFNKIANKFENINLNIFKLKMEGE